MRLENVVVTVCAIGIVLAVWTGRGGDRPAALVALIAAGVFVARQLIRNAGKRN